MSRSYRNILTFTVISGVTAGLALIIACSGLRRGRLDAGSDPDADAEVTGDVVLEVSSDSPQSCAPELDAGAGCLINGDSALSDGGADSGLCGKPRSRYYGMVVINEVASDPKGGLGGSDWIELLNVSPRTIDLKDWQLFDESKTVPGCPDNDDQLRFIEGTRIGAFSASGAADGCGISPFILVETGVETDAGALFACPILQRPCATMAGPYGPNVACKGCYRAGFGLAKDEPDGVWLMDQTGAVVAHTAFSPSAGDSWSRKTDGSYRWVTPATPGAPNGE